MRPVTWLFFSCFLAVTNLARADQQAPSQNSPAFQEYQEVPDTESDQTDERNTSSVTLHWQTIAQATHYVLKISKDPAETLVLYTVDTVKTMHETPELAPGAYYFSVQGLQQNRFIGQLPPEPFVVGKPLSLTGRHERLLAPTIIGPKHMDLFPTYGFIRASWTPVEGARGYRFRLWDEDKVTENVRWKRETPPRWVTEVRQPWIEINDVPYASYMYLDSSTYRWEVSAVDKDGGLLGEAATAYFRTSRQWFLKPREVVVRFGYGYAPSEIYREASAMTGNQTNFQSSSHRLTSDLDVWLFRQWGFNIAGGLDSFHVQPAAPAQQPADTETFINLSASALFRTYLSTVPWGWTLTLAAGLGMKEFPEVNQYSTGTDTLNLAHPKALGAKFGFRLEKKFFAPWELRFEGNWLVNAYTLSGSSGTSKTNTPIDGDVALKAVFPLNPHLAAVAGIGYEIHKISYEPLPQTASSSVALSGFNATIGLQLDLYEAPDNTTYYPDHESAYYPSERPMSFYRTDESRPDEYHRDATPWQRWRDRSP